MNETKSSSGERTKKYIRYLFLILALVQIMDAYTTTYTAAFPSKIIEEFLIIPYSMDINVAQAILSFSIGIATAGMYFVFFNQYFADKLGRKKMLGITTLGMGVSALLLALSINIWLYTIFLFCTYLFFSSDMWLLYANEESPAKKKAVYTNLLLAFGVMGPIMMPLMRSVFITETSPLWMWRGMTLFPIILGIPLGIVIFFTIRETKIYETAKIEGKLEVEKIFLKENVKIVFQSPYKKEYIVLLVMSFTAGLNFVILQLAESFLAQSTTLGEGDINLIIIIVALSVILGYLLTGFIADRIGRKPLMMIYSFFVPVGAIFLFLGSQITTNVFLIASLGVAFVYIGYNGLLIVIRIVVMEIMSTDTRGTGMGVRGLTTALGITTGFLVGAGVTLFSNLGLAFILLSLPLFANLFLVLKYLKETKGTDLSTVEIKA